MEIIPIEYGKSVLPEKMIFQGGKEGNFRDIVFKVYLIKTDDKLILVDAGCETMPGFEMRDFVGAIVALERIGVSPSDITDCIITHSHHDHIECVKYFKNATIHIEENEYGAGRKYIPDGFAVSVFKGKYSVCLGVEIIKIGGHSQGSCVVEIAGGEKTYVIAGDECYLRECLTNNIPTGSTVNLKASRDFTTKYRDGKYIVLLCHDE